ncbi:MAG: lysylphosphatidylglycerol synthase transmembrane domain-containing protein [Dehalococcoidia bacterium]
MEYPKELGAAASPSLLKRAYPLLRVLFQLTLAGGLLTALLLSVDRAAVREQIGQADLIWLPLAFAANIGSDWFRAIRWQHLMSPLRRLGVPFLFWTALLGVTINIVLPFRMGEVVRVQLVRRRSGLSASSIVATIVSEKLADVVVFSTFIVVGFLLYREATFLWPLAVAYGVLLLAAALGARYLLSRVMRRPARPGRAERGRLRSWIRREASGFTDGLQALRRPTALFHIAWSAHAAWLLEATMYYAFGRALGLDISPGVYLLVVVAAAVAFSVPVTLAGLGVFEVAIVGLLVAFGVNEAEAVAYAIFAHIFFALPYIVSGPIAAFALRLNVSDILFLRRLTGDREHGAGLTATAEEPAAGR